MSNKKKIIFGVCFIVFLVTLWLATYHIWLSVEPKGDNFITAEQLSEIDKGIHTEAKVFIGSTEYNLQDLNKDILQGVVIVYVELDSKKVQGYVVFDDTVLAPIVEYSENDSYAKVILPYNK